jgi:hypothetical protein
MLGVARVPVVAGALIVSLGAAVKVDKVAYQGWPNCYRVSNGEIEAIVTGDIGPRVIRFGFVGGRNFFKEYGEQLGKTGEEKFQLRGGHRVWKAPEDPIATWAPDNAPVEVRITEKGVVAREPVEPLTGLQKEIGVEMEPSGASVTVTHRIANKTLFTLEFAPWAMTMLAQGGLEIAGFPPRGKHPDNLEVTNPLSMWAYTDLSDKRLTLTRKYLLLRQDPNNAQPQKVGLFNPKTWAAYLLDGDLFLKSYEADPRKTYTDFGCSFETFTNDEFLEMETLGPIAKVAPGESVTHVERWSLHRGIRIAAPTDAELDRVLGPLVP